MEISTELEYLAPIELWNEVKPFKLEGRLPPGTPRSNIEGRRHAVQIKDMRKFPDEIGLEKTGFAYSTAATTADLATREGIDQNVEEMRSMLQSKMGADKVYCFAYTVFSISERNIVMQRVLKVIIAEAMECFADASRSARRHHSTKFEHSSHWYC